MTIRVITNHHERDIIEGYELTEAERQEFDYIDWSDPETNTERFFRYHGSLYDLGEFSADFGITKGSGLPDALSTWHGYLSDSALTAVVVRYTDDQERVVVGRVLS